LRRASLLGGLVTASGTPMSIKFVWINQLTETEEDFNAKEAELMVVGLFESYKNWMKIIFD
jgi:hypothetical protein